MKFIYFLRHASAGESVANAEHDRKRPLDKKGVEQCRAVGRFLRELEICPELIVLSPLQRAVETAALVSRELRGKPEMLEDAALAPGAAYASFQQLLARHKGRDSVMVVGHNPNLSEFLSRLVSGSACGTAFEMKKGAMARVATEAERPLLEWLITPKLARLAQDSKAASSRPKISRK